MSNVKDIPSQRNEAVESVKSLNSFKESVLISYANEITDVKKLIRELYDKLNEKRRAIILANKEKTVNEIDNEKVEQENVIEDEIKVEQESPESIVEVQQETVVEETVIEPIVKEEKVEAVPVQPKKEQRIVRFNINDGQYSNANNGRREQRTPNFKDKDRTRNNDYNGNRGNRDVKQKQNGASSQKYEAPIYTVDSNNGKAKDKDYENKKKENKNNYEDKQVNKKIKVKVYADGYDDDESVARRLKARKPKKVQTASQITVIDHAVINSDPVTIRLLSEKIGKPATDIIKQLFLLGIQQNINGSIDFETASLVSAELGVTIELKKDDSLEEKLEKALMENEGVVDEANLVERPPIVTVMGHVDHGKTSILDYIRKAKVAAGEAGGITQHIGAYTIKIKGKQITFIDTPGHEAFTAMRARGAQITDIAIIVVAADDGIMPQTVEAINHAKSAGVEIMIAINKIDKPEANIDRTMQQLMQYDIVPEEWGGQNMCVPVSAKTGQNIDKLLEDILLVAEYNGYKADPKSSAKGTIIESRLDKNRGPIATVLVQNGTLKVSDYVVAGSTIGKIKSMIDDNGKVVKEAGPSVPVSVLGFTEVPNAGDNLVVVKDEKLARQVAEERSQKAKEKALNGSAARTIDEMMNGDVKKDLNVIIKTDVQGSLEALKQELSKLVNEEAKINIVHGAVGGINDSDVMLATTTHASIIGFNTRPFPSAKDLADKNNIQVRTYRIIYELIEDLQLELKGMLAPKFKEVLLGHAEVRQLFRISGVGTIAGSHVLDGKITRTSKMRLVRNGVIITEGAVSSLKREKNDAKEVASGFDCGIGIENYNDIKEGDIIEAFVMEEVKL